MSDDTIGERLEDLANDAADYLEAQIHRDVKEVLIHCNREDRIAVFEMETEPVRVKSGAKIRRWWVVSGADMPTTWTPMEKSPGPRSVLAHYIEIIKKWAEAVATGREPPVKVHLDVPAEPAYARKVLANCQAAEKELLPTLQDKA